MKLYTSGFITNIKYILALLFIINENGSIFPCGGMPIGVIVTFLRALVTTSVSIGILTRVDSRAVTITIVFFQVLVSSKEA